MVIISLFTVEGQLSEEAAEAYNKEYRLMRRDHTRKNSRINTNTDLLNMLLVSSDPYVSSIRKTTIKKEKNLKWWSLYMTSFSNEENNENSNVNTDSDSEKIMKK